MKLDYSITNISNTNAKNKEQQTLKELQEEREMNIQQRLIAKTIIAGITLVGMLLFVDFVFWLTA